jgi:hypothetical protein
MCVAALLVMQWPKRFLFIVIAGGGLCACSTSGLVDNGAPPMQDDAGFATGDANVPPPKVPAPRRPVVARAPVSRAGDADGGLDAGDDDSGFHDFMDSSTSWDSSYVWDSSLSTGVSTPPPNVPH